MVSDDSTTNSFFPEFGAAEKEEAAWLIERALHEDIPEGDLTSNALFRGGRHDLPGARGGSPGEVRMEFVSRSEGVLCGLPVAAMLYAAIDDRVTLTASLAEGSSLTAGVAFAEVRGPPVSVLSGERAALNFLQLLSGVATTTSRWVDVLVGFDAVLLDTRKTTPAWRGLEKYAVRVGGGTNHRPNLSHCYLLKDNHAWILRASGRADLRSWVALMRQRAPDKFLEIEVDTREEFLDALEARVDAILLDNFSLEDLRWAVETNRAAGEPRPLLEASGGIHLGVLKEVAATGVDRISAGSLTHAAPALDISLECVEICEPGQGKETKA